MQFLSWVPPPPPPHILKLQKYIPSGNSYCLSLPRTCTIYNYLLARTISIDNIRATHTHTRVLQYRNRPLLETIGGPRAPGKDPRLLSVITRRRVVKMDPRIIRT